MTLPPEFINNMAEIIGKELPSFLDSMQEKIPVSVRLNPNKKENDLTLSNAVPWCNNAYYLEERPSFTLDPFFHAGHYYPQESASMHLANILEHLELPNEATVLDMCAAPGGKTTILLDKLSDSCIVHAHEFLKSRAEILRQNIEKWGNSNVIITQGSLSKFKKQHIQYDLVLVDAPCSGEGMFRKEKAALEQWSNQKIHQCIVMQDEALQVAFDVCKEGGYIIYSTCTYNIFENENRLIRLSERNNFSSQKLNNINTDIYYSDKNQIHTYRCLPHKIKGEGYCFSVIRKEEDTNIKKIAPSPVNQKLKSKNTIESNLVNQNCQDFKYTISLQNSEYLVNEKLLNAFNSFRNIHDIIHIGIPYGTNKGADFYPAHGLCLCNEINKDLPTIQLPKKEVIELLRGISFGNSTISSKWLILNYKSARILWLKNNHGTLKNYLPKNQRIKSNI